MTVVAKAPIGAELELSCLFFSGVMTSRSFVMGQRAGRASSHSLGAPLLEAAPTPQFRRERETGSGKQIADECQQRAEAEDDLTATVVTHDVMAAVRYERRRKCPYVSDVIKPIRMAYRTNPAMS